MIHRLNPDTDIVTQMNKMKKKKLIHETVLENVYGPNQDTHAKIYFIEKKWID